MNLIDSSCWIEFLSGFPKASLIEKYVKKADSFIIPTIVIYEVFRKLIMIADEREAIFSIAQLREGYVVGLDHETAMFAANLSIKHKLAMADAIIYASALIHDAKVITLDSDFRGLTNCIVID